MYEVYTLPTCPHCHHAIELMRRNKIEFEQINAGISTGLERFKEIYAKYREQIVRYKGGTTILPVVLYQDNGNTRIHQGTEGLERFLGIK